MGEEERGYDYLFKLLIIGDAGVGKSAILIRFADNTFSSSYINTIVNWLSHQNIVKMFLQFFLTVNRLVEKPIFLGVDFKIRTIEVGGERVKLQIWDTAGQERFRTITSTYYRGTNGIILVFDVTTEVTFVNVKKWLQEIEDNDCQSVPRVLVGNKIDCPNRAVQTESAEKFAKSKKLAYFESSAKLNEGVLDVFLHVAKMALAKKHVTDRPKGATQQQGLDLKEHKSHKKSKCC